MSKSPKRIGCGTPQYMSPEQCSQTGPWDLRSDVYSLGIIVYEMLTGRVPFTGESATVIMMKQVQDSPPSVLTARADLPAGVDAVIKQALAKQPVDRFQSAGDLSAALAKSLSEAGEAAAVVAINPAATVANKPVGLVADDDEETVVRPRYDSASYPEPRYDSASYREQLPAPPPARFNPWRVMVPAAIALVAVFAIVFFLTRGAGQADQTQGQPMLTVDPNGQPVQPAGTPTGQTESDIRSTVPTPIPGSTPAATANTAQVPAKVTGDFGATDNSNSNKGNQNSNSPRATPAPKVEVPDAPPPPKPSPTARAVPKATAQPASSPDQR